MGNNNSTPERSRSVIGAPPENEGESPIYINSLRIKENGGMPFRTLRSCPECDTIPKVLDHSAVKFGDADALGEREQKPDGTFGEYRWMSYKQFRNYALHIASGLSSLGYKKGDTIGIYSHSCMLWQIIFFGCQYGGFIPVPVYDSLGAGAAKYIVEHSECKAIFVTKAKVDPCIVACEGSSVRDIFLMTLDSNNVDQKLKSAADVIECGKEYIEKFEAVKCDPEDTAIYMYTSGSTGNPKGCILKQIGIVGGGAGLASVGASVLPSDSYFSFLPLAHVYEMCVQIVLIAQGVKIGFSTGNVRNLIEDMKVMQPTITCAVPRVFNRIYQSFNEKIEELSWPMKSLIRWAIKSKNAALVEVRGSSLLMDILFSKFRAALGGRIRLIVSGGAPILPEVYVMIRSTLTPNVIQGYGLTEICASGCVQEVGAVNPGDVGPVAVGIEMKLCKVDGLNYDPLGTPPTGEIKYRGSSLFKGYYKNEELTKEVYQDGWFSTGDIGMITDDGYVQIIDRVKQLVKLSQGEYLSLTTLTEKYCDTPYVESIYIYADSHHSAPVALVVPTEQKIEEWKSKGIDKFKESDIARKEMIEILHQQAQKLQLRGFERIIDIAFDDEPFSIQNGLLTPSLKPQLHSLRTKYESMLRNVYERNQTLNSHK